MAKQVIWSKRAIDDLENIFEYWNNRNKSNKYSKQLYDLFSKSIYLITNYSSVGRPTQLQNIKIIVVKDYLIIYEDIPELIIILTIWDSRQDPKQLEEFLK